MKRLFTFAKPYWLGITITITAILLVTASTLIQPQLLEKMMTAIIHNDSAALLSNGIGLLLLALVGILAGVANTAFAAKVSQGIAADFRQAEYEKIQRFSMENVQTFTSANLVVRLTNDVNQVQQLTMQLLQTVIRVPVLFIGAVTLAIYTLPQLWWVVVLMVLGMVLLSKWIVQTMGKLFGKVQRYIEESNTAVKEDLAGVRLVRSFNQEEQEEATFAKSTDQLVQVNKTISYCFNIIFPAFMLLSYAAIVAALLIISQTITHHPSELAKISPFITYLNQILNVLLIAGMVSTFAARGFVSLQRIGAVLDTKETMPTEAEQDWADLDQLTGALSVRQVSFTYPQGEQPVLQNLSFDLSAGETLGVVGTTGSGKSTLAALLDRLYDPQDGAILVDGVPLTKVRPSLLRREIALAMQKPVLFSGTIAANLKMGNQNASQADLVQAAQQAQAAEFIDRYPAGYEQTISERSSNLSGGQRQRLSLARALVKQPKILILDDVTSALDARSEKLVQQALAEDFQQTTKIIIAEKLSSVVHADQLIVLDQGQIVAKGTHQTLLAQSPLYQKLYQSQQEEDQHAAF
ncbi:ABC transporter ATP-binding protein [Leuconostocaceae bacterium ESL0958]|nr:ABC transporter ATP-binding protein [Leuconostocaceae bacterium ESL0958]